MSAFGWALSPDLNAVADPTIPAQDGASARTFMPQIRGVMAGVRALADDQGGALTTAGSGNAYAVTTKSGVAQLRGGLSLLIQLDRSNTDLPTLNVDGTGPKPLYDMDGLPLAAGALRGGRFGRVLYDPTLGGWRVDTLALLDVAALVGGAAKMKLARAAFLAGGFTLSTAAAADNGPAITAAFRYAGMLGIPIDGERVIYPVATRVDLWPGNDITRLRLRDNAPNSRVDRRIVYGDTVPNLLLTDWVLDRAGDGTNGVNGDGISGAGSSLNVLSQGAAGLYLSFCTNGLLRNIEVFGDNQGSGIQLVDCTDVDVERPYVHDMKFKANGLVDDAIQGIAVARCTGVRLIAPRVKNLLGNATNATKPSLPQNPGGAFIPIFTRLISITGSTNCTVLLPELGGGDQGIDISGNGYNTGIQIIGGHIQGTTTWGVKAANAPKSILVLGVKVTNAGLSAFVAAGPSDPSDPALPIDVVWRDCEAIDTGNVYWASNTTAGFAVLLQPTGTAGQQGFPQGVRAFGCRAREGRSAPGGTDYRMKKGFVNQIAYTPGGLLNTVDRECVSTGHTVSAFEGWHTARVRLGLAANITLTNNAETSIQWTREDEDSMGLHAAGDRPFVAPYAGTWRFESRLLFQASASGTRTILYRLNGGSVVGYAQAAPPSPTDLFLMSGPVVTLSLAAGDQVDCRAIQTSGGDLAVATTFTMLRVDPVM